MLFVFVQVEMVAGIEGRFFEGPQHQKSPRYSLTDFDNGLYRCGYFYASKKNLILYVMFSNANDTTMLFLCK